MWPPSGPPTGSWRFGAYSERWRSAFRGDGDHDSELMPIAIPRCWRSRFRRDADHFSAVLGMVIGIVGIVLLSRLHEARWANWRQTGLHWKVEDPSCRKKGCPCARSKKSLDFNPWGCHSAR